jgi:hypothetical protein
MANLAVKNASGTTVYLSATGAGTDIDPHIMAHAALAAGSNNIGDVDVVSLPALPTGSNNIGDVDIASLPAYSPPTTTPLTNAAISFSSSGDNTVVSGTGGQTIRVHRMVFVVTSAVNVTVKDGASTSLTGAMPMTAYGGVALDLSDTPWFVTASGNALVINLSAAVQVSGFIQYTKG